MRTISNKNKRGTSTVEFALALPILLLVVFGILDMCMFYFQDETMSETTREAARYAVTGELMSNPSYNTNSSNSFPYYNRRQSILETARTCNADPFHTITYTYHAGDNRYLFVNPTNPDTRDMMELSSSTSFDGPWVTTCGLGGDYIRVQYKVPYSFLTPFMNLLLSKSGASSKTYMMTNTLIMRNELFFSNSYPSTNAKGYSNNYWN